MSGGGWYVYGVVDGDRAVDAGEDVRLVRRDALAAVVAPVDLAEFDDLEERLNDRRWLEEKALEHETVIRAAAAGGPVVPLRFGAIYHRLDDVEQLLDERAGEFAADLDHVRGRVELGVKGFVERTQLEDALARERAHTPAADPGRAYLERRSIQQAVAAEAAELLAEAARTAHTRLLERSLAGAVSRPHTRELSGRPEEMFLNAAYLVEAGDESLREEVAALGQELAPLAVTLEVTGPWPPYSFVGRGAPAEEAVR